MGYISYVKLSKSHPELAAELDDPSIGDILTYGSNKKVRWVCSEGHWWSTTVASRSKGKHGCPTCAGQKASFETCLNTVNPVLATELFNPFDGYFVTKFSNRQLKWICESGHTWDSAVNNRSTRDTGCPLCSCLLKTHPNLAAELVTKSDALTVSKGSNIYLEWKCSKGHIWKAKVVNRVYGNGCPFCSNQKVSFESCLNMTHPELASELYNYYDGFYVTYGSRKKLKWICESGHVWFDKVNNRSNGSKCRLCNCLTTVNPKLALELVNPLDGFTVSAGSNRYLEWKCSSNHIWKAQVANRTNGRSCPSCAKTGFNRSKRSYLYILKAPTHLVYGISGINANTNRISKYPKDRELLFRFEGSGEQIWEVEREIGQTFQKYTDSKASGEVKESLILGQEDALYNFLIEKGLVEIPN